MITLQRSFDCSLVSLKDSVSTYSKGKSCLESISKVSIACIVLGIVSFVAGLALLASPVGAGVVIGLAVTGAVIAIAAGISLLFTKVLLKCYDTVLFAPVNSLRCLIGNEYKQIVRDMVSWDDLSEAFLVAASSKVHVSLQIADTLSSDFFFVYTPEVLADRGSVLMQMLLRVSNDYYAVKNACRESPSGGPEKAPAYEAEFYHTGTVQCDLRTDYNTLCAKIADVFADVPGASSLIECFRMDLIQTE
ncbi:MAG: hypothetical protein RR302_02100 [Victivallaceae bacterium]